VLGIGFAAALVMQASPAHAQGSVAEALFQEGKRLMAEGKYNDACPKLAESQRIDPGAGTLTALALCHRGEGKTATAWSEFKEVISLARRDNRKDREQVAQDNVAELEPKLSRLRLVVDPAAEAQHVEVRIDDTVVTRAAFGQALPVDPGTRRVLATAPGKKPFEATIQIGTEHDEKSIAIPKLEEDPRAAEAIGERSPPASSPNTTKASDKTNNQQRLVVPTLISLGIGVVGVGVGTVFGLQALGMQSDLDASCPTRRCAPNARNDIDSLLTSSTISTIGFIAGGVGLVGAAILYIAGRPSTETGTAKVRPVVGPSGVGATF
jgi:hypothetical protein